MQNITGYNLILFLRWNISCDYTMYIRWYFTSGFSCFTFHGWNVHFFHLECLVSSLLNCLLLLHLLPIVLLPWRDGRDALRWAGELLVGLVMVALEVVLGREHAGAVLASGKTFASSVQGSNG